MIPGKEYQRLIVGPEIIPDSRLLHQLIRAYPAGNIIIHLLLVVPFEHFRPKHKPGRILLPEGLGQLKLKPMRHRTVMGLAEQHDIGLPGSTNQPAHGRSASVIAVNLICRNIFPTGETA